MRRSGFRLRSAVLLAAALAGAAACGSGGSNNGSGSRPTSPVRIQILAPTAGEVVQGTTTTVKLGITGGQVVARVTGPITPTEGHIHVQLDGTLVSMSYGTTQQLTGLKPGQHALFASFVATDHKPFANQIIASVTFTVEP